MTDNWDRCGYGTPWGCGRLAKYPSRLLLHGRRPESCGPFDDPGHVLFCVGCWPDIATRSAFSVGLAAEVGEVRPTNPLPCPACGRPGPWSARWYDGVWWCTHAFRGGSSQTDGCDSFSDGDIRSYYGEACPGCGFMHSEFIHRLVSSLFLP